MLHDAEHADVNNYFKLSPSKNTPSSRKYDYTMSLPESLSRAPIAVINKAALSTTSVPNPPKTIAKKDMNVDQALLGPLVLTGADLISDLSSHVRKSFDSANIIYGTENPIALAALGFTTGFSLLSGGLNAKEGREEAKIAQKISDETGKSLAYLQLASGSAQAAGGGLYIPMRALMIASLITASKVCATIAAVLGSLGGTCFNIASIVVVFLSRSSSMNTACL